MSAKSTLFNIFANSRFLLLRILRALPVTVYMQLQNGFDHEFMMVDTGGIEIMNADAIAVSIRQTGTIKKEADVILFVCDARSGITTEDADVARLLRQSKNRLF